jgi:HK97 family phage prohead protease
MKDKKQKEIRLNNVENLQIRNDGQEENKMVIEGYPIVFDKETYIDCFFSGWYEKIDRNAFANADMSDVCLKYNHNDDFFIMARTRNNSLQLTIDDHGVFMHAELINTTQNRDVYEMVKSELLKEGSFAFTVEEWTENIDANEDLHRTINKIGKLFDVAICPNGAYGDMTEIYARSYDLLENNHKKLESLKRCKLLKLRNKNKIKLMEAKK